MALYREVTLRGGPFDGYSWTVLDVPEARCYYHGDDKVQVYRQSTEDPDVFEFSHEDEQRFNGRGVGK